MKVEGAAGADGNKEASFPDLNWVYSLTITTKGNFITYVVFLT